MNIAALLAGLLSGMAGAMGLGGGGVLIIYLSLFTETDRVTAGGINLLFFVPIALLSVIIYTARKEIKWKTVLPFAAWGLLGALTGMWLISLVGSALLGKLFGGFLLLLGIKEIFTKKEKN